ncbi:MAG: diguanylate cyclase [Candidatus Thiodiazotropha sp. (ex. Lucinisca nassula)]|nr:diguanylate cyclase [Candidatus Thiodiazotropha sp. (ex. Lucinisca nassula)]
MRLIRDHIGNKILGVVGVSALVSLLGMVLFYTWSEKQSILEQYTKGRQELLNSVDRGLHFIMITGSADAAEKYARQLLEAPDVTEFLILRTDGKQAFLDNDTIHQVNWSKGEELFNPRDEETERQVLAPEIPEFRRTVQEEQTVLYNEQASNGEPLITFLKPLVNDEECHRCHEQGDQVLGVIKLSSSLQATHDEIEKTWQTALVVLGIFLLIMLLITAALMRRTIIAPVQSVTKAMRQVEEGDFTQQVPVLGNDELGRMARSFNSMIERLLQTYTGLQREQDKLTTIILSSSEGIIVTDHNDHVVLVNPAAERLLGKSMGQIIREGFKHLADQPDVLQQLMDGKVEDSQILKFNNRLLQIYAARIRRSDGEPIGSAALIQDVTEQKRLESELRQLSFNDQLTGLYNRRSLEKTLKKQLHLANRHHSPLAIVLFDVDHFKHFNDTYGHDQGDRVLSTLGGLCMNTCRETDHPCRYGGEEFCIILPHTNHEGAMVFAEKLRRRVERARVDELQVTISLGVACTVGQKPIHDLNIFIKQADQALYEAKNQGRNRAVLAFSRDSNQKPDDGDET